MKSNQAWDIDRKLGRAVHAKEGLGVAGFVGNGDAHFEFEFGRLPCRRRDCLFSCLGVNAVLDNRHRFASLEPHVVGDWRRCVSVAVSKMVGSRPAVNLAGQQSRGGEFAMRRLMDVLNARPKDRVIAAPGVYDMVSLRMAAAMGFEALYMTGYGAVASNLGLPDAGLASYADMVGRVEAMARMAETPLIADGDTGYGGLLNVRHAVRGYERAGAAAIQLEDQEFPKKCGHTPDRRVIPADEMVRKIAVAAEARTSQDFLIIARTDARTSKGLSGAIRRARAYAEAGADMLFVESPETEDEMATIGRELGDKPLIANMVEGGRTPMLSNARLAEIGYALAIYPVAGLLSAAAALETVYRQIRETGSSLGSSAPLYAFAEMNRLMGFEEVWRFDTEHAEI
jgi:2-methylisocitrate lyase-like PEP mutase family enzyme